jgi:hypothetical protein
MNHNANHVPEKISQTFVCNKFGFIFVCAHNNTCNN